MSTETVITMSIALIALVLAVIGILRKGGDIDTGATERLREYQANRENMARLEKLYAQQSDAYHKLVNILVGGLRFVAPLTEFKTDDAVLDVLEDIQKEG